MKVLIVSGSPWSRYQEVFGLLTQSGVANAKTAERGSSVSIDGWHQRAVPDRSETFGPPIPQPGRTLDQVAADIFVANWDQPLWGWADHRSARLLDYWANFDEAVRFLLVCTPPEIAVGRAIMDLSAPPVAPDRVAKSWLGYHTEMMRFYHRFRDRCLLVDETGVSTSASALIESCTKNLELPLTDRASPLNLPVDAPLGIMLARQFLETAPEIGELWREIESSRTMLADDDTPRSLPDSSIGQVIVEIGRMIRMSAANLASMTTAKEQSEENAGQLERKLTTTIKHLAHSESALESATQKLAEQTTLADQLRQEIESFSGLIRQSELAREEAQTRLAQVENSLQQHINALNRAEQTVGMAVRQRDAEKSQAEKLQNDRDLILAQLNQVQDEMEHQFGQNKLLKKAKDDSDRRWEKLLRRHPDYLDFESIEIIDSPQTESAMAIQWRIDGLYVGKRRIPHLDITTLLIGENTALLLQRDPQQGSEDPLLSWPLEAADQPLIVLQPKGPDEDLRKRWSILHGLSTTDWRLINALCSNLADFIRARQRSLAPSLNPELWMQRLSALREQFRAIPIAFRYDKVILRRQVLNSDYEHLWLRLENAQFGTRHWVNFEFRLAASLVQPVVFSQYPKLEFPPSDDGPHPFENWFAETSDELGPRYELRFALAEQAVDMDVFNRLTTTDQHQLISLLVNLPTLLTKLEKSGVKIARPWEDWQRLVMGMIDVLRIKLAQPQSTPSETEQTAAQETPVPVSRITVSGKSRKQSSRRR